MKRFLMGTCCIGLVLLFMTPGSAYAQGLGGESGASSIRDQDLGTRNAAVATINEARLTVEDYEDVNRGYVHTVNALDNRLTSKTIAWEHAKDLVLDDVVKLIRHAAKAKKRSRDGKVSTEAENVAYEKLPDDTDMRAILPSVISITSAGEKRSKGAVEVEAESTISVMITAQMVIMVHERSAVAKEIRTLEALGDEAMAEIDRVRDALAESGATDALKASYRGAVDRLIAVDYAQKARQLEFRSEIDKAMDAVSKAIDADPGLAIAYRCRGRMYRTYQKDNKKAIADFTKALEAYSGDASAHTRSKEYGRCVEYLDAALKLNGTYAYGYYQRAVCNIGLGDQANGKADFIKAAQLGDKGAQELLSARGMSW